MAKNQRAERFFSNENLPEYSKAIAAKIWLHRRSASWEGALLLER
jgi:hypothetical protein